MVLYTYALYYHELNKNKIYIYIHIMYIFSKNTDYTFLYYTKQILKYQNI